jgi:hypothetical protein
VLFQAGVERADHSFGRWLTANAQRVVALSLSCEDGVSVPMLLEDWVDDAAAAQAAGQPLSLHTLRVLRGGVDVKTVGRLLAALPNLRCLQLGMSEIDPSDWLAPGEHDPMTEDLPALQQALQQATQLQELYLVGPYLKRSITVHVAGMLPPSLRRLSWCPIDPDWTGDLSHLTQLTFLQLSGGQFERLRSRQLPSRLQQLELLDADIPRRVAQEQRKVVTGLDINDLNDWQERQILACLSHLKSVGLDTEDFYSEAGGDLIQQLPKLSALRMTTFTLEDTPQALRTAAGIGRLRRLHLDLQGMPDVTGVTALTRLTQLRVSINGDQGIAEEQRACVHAVGRLTGLNGCQCRVCCSWQARPGWAACSSCRCWWCTATAARRWLM